MMGSGGTIACWSSAAGGPYLRSGAELAFRVDADGQENRLLNVYRDVRHQELVGFGAAITEASAEALRPLPQEARDRAVEACFSSGSGNGYALARTHMGSCDFSLGNYSHAEDKEAGLAGFTVERDRRTLLPLLRSASRYAGRPVSLIVSPWSPPAWMKDNGEMNGGGRLLPRYRADWARYFALFIAAYAEEGVPTWAVTVQNEPKACQRWDSCVWEARDERDFIRDHLGPELARSGFGDVRILGWDHNKERAYVRAAALVSDPDVASLVSGIGFHWYSGDHFGALEALAHSYPGLLLLGTEACQEGGPKPGSWDVAERYAHAILGDLAHGAHGWVDWNFVLDASGGPNHVNNFCDAPIVADAATGEIGFRPSYYAIGHFSRFITPGSVRIGTSCFTDRLESVAFERPDGKTAIVILNRGQEGIPLTLRDRGLLADYRLPPRSITTLLY